jgi:hypothetical protein
MTRNQIEIKITEAIDGDLSSAEIKNLLIELEKHPDLADAFELLKMDAPLETAFPLVAPTNDQLSAIRSKMDDTFETAVIHSFPRFLLAAGILFLAMMSLFRISEQQPDSFNDQIIQEWIHMDSSELVFNEISPLIIPIEPSTGE